MELYDPIESELARLKNIVANVEAGNINIDSMNNSELDEDIAEFAFLISVNIGCEYNHEL